MATLTVVERLDVLEHCGLQLEPRGQPRRLTSSFLSVAKKVSATALSYASPRDPIETAIPASLAARPNARLTYWAAGQEWSLGGITGISRLDGRSAAQRMVALPLVLGW